MLTLPALFGDRGDDVCRHSELIEVGFLTDCSEVEIGNGYPVGLELGDEGVQERLKSICFGVQGAIPGVGDHGFCRSWIASVQRCTSRGLNGRSSVVLVLRLICANLSTVAA